MCYYNIETLKPLIHTLHLSVFTSLFYCKIMIVLFFTNLRCYKKQIIDIKYVKYNYIYQKFFLLENKAKPPYLHSVSVNFFRCHLHNLSVIGHKTLTLVLLSEFFNKKPAVSDWNYWFG
jgi:hypothetical protein